MRRVCTAGIMIFISAAIMAQTPAPQAVPGTKYRLIPPQAFVPATGFSGFQNNELGASIMLAEIPAPIELITAGFTTEALATKGMTLIEKTTLPFQKDSATLAKVSQQANGVAYLKLMLLWGDEQKTLLINGIYPAAHPELEAVIRSALLTVSYEETQAENPLEAVKFSIDTDGTELKFAKFLSGTLIYTTTGQLPTQKPSLIVGTAIDNSSGPVSTAQQKEFCLKRLQALPNGETAVVRTIEPLTIDQLPGYEIVANLKSKDGLDELVYQVMLFMQTGEYFIIVGLAKEAPEKYLAMFRAVAKTFRRRL